MPKIFQDIVQISYVLNVPYIWINALRIVEDKRFGWNIESARMGNAYCQSYITIANIPAKDAFRGCFSGTETMGGKSSVPLSRRIEHDKQKISAHPDFLVRSTLDHSSFRDRSSLFGLVLGQQLKPLQKLAFCFQEGLLFNLGCTLNSVRAHLGMQFHY